VKTILGIETSCDETAAAVVRDGVEILSSVVVSQEELHAEYGGVVPEIACRVHLESLIPVVDQALNRSGLTREEIDLIAVTSSPGLIGALLLGVSFAKSLALAWSKPLLGVDHIHAHLYAAKMGCAQLDYPCLSLLVSGGHTSLYESRSEISHRLVGSTLDDAVGEAFDKAAKILGLGFPGGPAIQRAAEGQDFTKERFGRPMGDDTLDFSFSGIKTAVLYRVKGQDAKSERPLSKGEAGEIAAGFQEAVVDVLVEKTIRAARGLGMYQVAVGGGVAANRRLRERLPSAGREHGIEVLFPPMELCTDNAAMVAGVAFHLARAGRFSGLDLDAVATKDYRS
jgi:N6-L-threonylcarbamoyladenine synthase